MIGITKQRESLGITKKALANKVGVTDSAICQYESGKRIPNIHIIKRIANVLACSVDDLIKEED